MAAQGIKLMERLKDAHGDEGTLNQKIHIGSCFSSFDPVHVPRMVSVGPPSLKFSPLPGSVIPNLCYGKNTIKIKVSLVAGEVPVLFPPIPINNCILYVNAFYPKKQVNCEINRANDQSSWNVVIKIVCKEDAPLQVPLTIKCQLSGAVAIETEVTYKA